MSEDIPKPAVPFTTVMKRETRKAHSLSDALINAKLAIGKLLAV